MMRSEANRQAGVPEPGQVGGGTADFAVEFKASFRALWLSAVGIVHDAALAEDVVQEAAVVALGKLDEYRPGTNFLAWMGQMVRYVALNRVRKEQKRRARPLDPEVLEAASSAGRHPSANGEGTYHGLLSRGELPEDQDLFDDRVLRALNELGEVPRACLLLRTLEDLAYSQIARLLGIPEGTAMSHVHRARRHLRERLGAGRAVSPDQVRTGS